MSAMAKKNSAWTAASRSIGKARAWVREHTNGTRACAHCGKTRVGRGHDGKFICSTDRQQWGHTPGPNVILAAQNAKARQAESAAKVQKHFERAMERHLAKEKLAVWKQEHLRNTSP